MGLEMDGAVQQAPQPGRQSINTIKLIARSACCTKAQRQKGLKIGRKAVLGGFLGLLAVFLPLRERCWAF
jgi:hypothetical protein